MEEAFKQISSLREPSLRTFINVIDILLVAYLIYRLLMLVLGTRAWRILVGIFIFVLMLVGSYYAQLNEFHWLLDKATALGPVALVILLLPELRQALEGVGKLGSVVQRFGVSEAFSEARTVEELVAAMAELSTQSVGALIVIERTASLEDIAANGVRLEAKLSAPLLASIFYGSNPLHDGAVIVRGDTVVAAACRLPLSESVRLDQSVHMRHRAAVGVTEAIDCVALVVSEERGTISIAVDGRLRRLANHLELRDSLNRELRGEDLTKSARHRKGQRRKEGAAR